MNRNAILAIEYETAAIDGYGYRDWLVSEADCLKWIQARESWSVLCMTQRSQTWFHPFSQSYAVLDVPPAVHERGSDMIPRPGPDGETRQNRVANFY